MQTDARTTVILGGTGKTGRRVADRLTGFGLPIRIGSRSGRTAFDWQDRDTWAPMLAGAGAVYMVYYPDLAAPEAAETVGSFAKLAAAGGVERIVLLSGRGEAGAERSEDAVRQSGADVTILRCSWFNQNFSEGHLLEAVLRGEIAFPAGMVTEPFVDADDIADVAVAALTEPGHTGQLYELTGPRLLTFADAAKEIAAATGRDISYVPVDPASYAAAMSAFMPAGEAAMLSELFAEVLDGHNAHLNDGVQRALNRPPRDFAEYAKIAAASGVWGG